MLQKLVNYSVTTGFYSDGSEYYSDTQLTFIESNSVAYVKIGEYLFNTEDLSYIKAQLALHQKRINVEVE